MRVWGNAIQQPHEAVHSNLLPDPHRANLNGLSRGTPGPITFTAKRSFKRAQRRAVKYGYTSYKGAIHTPATLNVQYLPNPQQKTTRRTSTARTAPSLRIMLWNASGLSVSRFAELRQWIAATEQAPDICLITESHWSHSCEYTQDSHHVINSGNGSWHGGVLALIRKSLCRADQIQVQEVSPGRLLHVRLSHTEVPTDVLLAYQYAWNVRAQLHSGGAESSEAALLTKRHELWTAIDRWITAVPFRHQLLIAGDLNCTLRPEGALVGRGVTSAPHPARDIDRVQQILRDHELNAVNTWQSRGPRAGTFKQSNGTHTQLDYFLMRRSQVTALSRRVQVCAELPFVPTAGMYHFPLFMNLPVPSRRLVYGPQPRRATLHSVKCALADDPTLVTKFQAALMRTLEGDKPATTVNEALMQAWTQIAPKMPSSGGPTASPNTTVLIRDLWAKRQAVRQATARLRALLGPQGADGVSFRVCAALFAEWRAQAIARTASKQLQKHCKQRKRQQVEDLIVEATNNGDSLTGLHRIMRRIAPKTPRRRMQLRGPAGELLGPVGQLKLLNGHFSKVYATDKAPIHQSHRFPTFQVTVHEIAEVIRSLPAKALPHTFAPAPLWRLGADWAAVEMHRELQYLAQCSPDHRANWHDISVALIPKPGKALSEPASYRPISLLPPYAKVLAQLIAERLRPTVLEAATSVEQYAYLPSRQTADALDRALAHCDGIRAARKANRTTIWTRKEGVRAEACKGGLTLSLDLERAFDSVPWSALEECLREFHVSEDLISLILFLHENARYAFSLSGVTTSVQPGQGIRQGCGMSPAVWTLFSIHLAKRLSQASASSLRTYFADDMLLQWEFSDAQGFRAIPGEIAAVLRLLRHKGMHISLSKTVILHSWWGSLVQNVTKPYLVRVQHKRYLRIDMGSGEEVRLPLVDSHKYLGVFLSYKSYETLSLKYRLQQSWIAFNRLTKALKCRALPIRLRLQLYNSVCLTTATYGLTSVGLSAEGRAKFRATITRQMRMVIGDHPYLTGRSNEEVLLKHNLADPLLQVEAHTRLRIDKARANCFLPTTEAVHARWDRLLTTFHDPTPAQPQQLHFQAAPEMLTCEICQEKFQTHAMLKFHHTRVHEKRTKEDQYIHTHVMRTRTEDHLKYCVGGMPTCRMCGHKFAAWPAFMSHHNRECCPVLHHGAPQPAHLRDLPPEPTPLAEDRGLLQAAADQSLPQVAELVHHRKRSHYCPICGIWITQPRYLAQHLTQQHQPVKQHMPHLKNRLKQLRVEWKTCPHCAVPHDRGAAGCPVFLTAAILKHCPPYATDPAQVVGTGAGTSGDGTVERAHGGTEDTGVCAEARARDPNGGHLQATEDQQRRSGGQRQGRLVKASKRREGQADCPAQRPDERRSDAHNCSPTPGGSAAAVSPGLCVRSVPADKRPPGNPNPAVQLGSVVERKEVAGPSVAGSTPEGGATGRSPSANRAAHPEARHGRGLSSAGEGQPAPVRGRLLQLLGVRHEGQELQSTNGKVCNSQGRSTSDDPRTPGMHPDPTDCASLSRFSKAHSGSSRGGSSVPPRGEQPRRDGAEGVLSVRQDRGQRHHALGSRQSQTRQDPQIPASPGSGQDCALKALCLLNRSNYCYTNALVITLLHIRLLHGESLYPKALDSFLLRLHRASNRHIWDDLAWSTLARGWQRPAQQHDVVELCSFLETREQFQHPCFQGRWQARSAAADVQVADAGHTWPLFLAELPTEHCSIQMLVDAWHAQARIHALSAAPTFLLIQLNRFNGVDGRRSQCKVQFGSTLSVPTYLRDDDLATGLVQYRLVSVILHKGVYSTSGHYQAATVHGDRLWLHDDGSKPKLRHSTTDLTPNLYLLCYHATNLEGTR